MKSFVALACLFSAATFAQEFRGTVTGSVSDSSGAKVLAAKIVLTETHTGTKVQTVSDSAGQYTAPFLAPGDYDISVKLEGFREFVRKGVHVGSGENIQIDARLDVGDVSQTVEVTDVAPLTNKENASIGQAITTKEVEDLPLNGRTPTVLASLSIGVLATGQPSLIHPFDAGAAAGWSIGGSPNQTNEIQVNGSPDTTWDGRLAYSPPTDAVQEVRIKPFDVDAATGHTGGGSINQILKTGTNSLHASAWEFNQPNTLIANNFFSNQKGLPAAVTHYNQYGFTAGGPIWIPKIVNGRNKLFFFFAFEGLKDNQPSTAFLSVATDKERIGDFSDLQKAAGTVIYNPFTATTSGTTVTRQPFSGNVINPNLISPIAKAYLALMPLPNLAGTGGGLNNYGSTASAGLDNYNNQLGRLDYNVSNRDRLFFDVRHTAYLQGKNDFFHNILTGSLLTRNNIGTTLDNVYTINPTNVLDVRFNFTRMAEAHPSPAVGVDPTSFGFPSYLAANSQYLQLPNLSFASNSNFTTLGFNGANTLPSQNLQLFTSLVSIHGNHTLKYGADLRQYNFNFQSFANSAGNFSFSANSWVRASSSASSTVVLGQDLAEFLLGLPTSGTFDNNTSAAYYEHYVAGFFQDDWRVTRTLTVNLGVRFDYDAPFAERYGRVINGFDTTSTSPLAAAAIAAYNAKPIPQIPVGSFKVLGGITYPTDRGIYNQNSHIFSPRVGLAWSPAALHGKTVFRTGFSMFVQPLNITQLAITGAYSTNPINNQQGFSQSTPLTASNDNFVTPAATLGNPFPSGFLQPAGSSKGLATFVGQSVTFVNPQVSDPYSLRWNFSIQHELTPNTLLEVAYIGNHGVHLPVFNTQLNGIPRQYLSTLPTRDQTLITALNATAANPFNGIITAGTPTGANSSVAQLLSRFPQFPTGTASFSSGVIEQDNTTGSSYFQSFNVRLQKRFSGGLTLIGNYIRSKLIERIEFLNDTDPIPEKRLSPFDHPNRFVLATTYELPFGRGKKFLGSSSRAMNLLVGGFGINSIYTYQTGAPITWVNGSTTNPGDYVYFGAPIVVNNREANVGAKAFNTTAFDTNSADAFQYHIRTFSTTFGNLRQDGINEWSPSVTKKFYITERMMLQIRCEAYNVLNHPTFAAPNTTANNAAFGTITAQANRTRTLQLGARFAF